MTIVQIETILVSSNFNLLVLQQIVPWVNLLISRLESTCVPRSGTYFQYFSQIFKIAGPGISSNGNGVLSPMICDSIFDVVTSNVVVETSAAVWSSRGIASARKDSLTTEAACDWVMDAAEMQKNIDNLTRTVFSKILTEKIGSVDIETFLTLACSQRFRHLHHRILSRNRH